uniref:Olfactory receptor n=1 Tax=Xenopus tropicalis TaxID=8364 RepID=A0A6I8QWX9_XENTR
MNIRNQTTPRPVILLGFHVFYNLKIPLFLLILTLYCLTLIGNIIIIALVSLSPTLHHPMFFFLSHLSLSDILLTTTIVPIMLCGILRGGVSISLAGCITQFNFFCTALASECYLLVVMSYDRYLAICNPLRYMSIMNTKLRVQLVVLCWFLSFTISTTGALSVSSLNFCGPNIIDHFFCDFFPILQLSCSDTSAVELEQILIAMPTVVMPVVFIVGTYICIFIAVLKIPSTSGRQKAFSTFSSHLSVVCIFFGSLICLYVAPPSGNLLTTNKVVSVLYTVVTPLSNSIIYSLRNSELRVAFKKFIGAVKTGKSV